MITNEIIFFENQTSPNLSKTLYNVNDGTLVLKVEGKTTALNINVYGNPELTDDNFSLLRAINATTYKISNDITEPGVYWIDINGIRKSYVQINSINGSVSVVGLTKSGLTTDLVARAMAAGAGSGGTSDYSQLLNKPSINGVELNGNKTNSDLKLASDNAISNASYNTSTGALTFVREDGEEITINLPSGLEIDGDTIVLNAESKAETVGIKDIHDNATNKFWTGTKAEYDAIKTKDENVFYAITDETDCGSFAITLTENGDGTYTSNKTYAQIKDAYEANCVLIACIGNSQLPLMNGEIGSDGGFGLTFGYTIIKSDGQVIYTRSVHYLHTSTQESWTEVDLSGEYLSNVFFDVTLTKDATAGLLSNKTLAEIKTAVASGLTVRAIYNNSLIPLTFMSNNTLIFTLISDSQSVTITCDNDVWTETVTKLLPLSGGAMDGNINMSGNSLLNVQKIHVDGEAPIYLGSTIETGVTNASRITGIAGGGAAVVRANTQNTYDPLFVAEPTNINHAATKGYVDSKITSNQLEHNTLYFGLIDGTNDNWFSKEKLQPVLQDAYINGYHDIMIKTTTGSRFITCSGGDLQSLGKDTTTNLQFVSLQNITGSTTAPTTIFYGYCYANGVKLDESGNVTISGSVGKSGGSVKAMKDTAFTEITGYDATKTQVLKNINGTLTWVNEG